MTLDGNLRAMAIKIGFFGFLVMCVLNISILLFIFYTRKEVDCQCDSQSSNYGSKLPPKLFQNDTLDADKANSSQSARKQESDSSIWPLQKPRTHFQMWDEEWRKLPIKKREINVVAWDWFGVIPIDGAFPKHCADEVTCHYTYSVEVFNSGKADAIIFSNFANAIAAPTRKKPEEKRIIFTMEGQEPDLRTRPEFAEKLDWLASYSFDGEIPSVYVNDHQSLADFQKPAAFKSAKPANPDDPIVSAFISNCASPRFDMLVELMQHVNVASYGACARNSGGADKDPSKGLKLVKARKYPFYLAWENNDLPYYVTEKFYEGFMSGSLPIYWGAPNIDGFLPGENSIIKVTDFPDMKALAGHLIMLTKNDAEYQKYFEWKSKPLLPNFVKIFNLVDGDWLRHCCFVCERLSRQEPPPPKKRTVWEVQEHPVTTVIKHTPSKKRKGIVKKE